MLYHNNTKYESSELLNQRAGINENVHRLEEWRDRLTDEGDEALAELLKRFPSADRQHLRQLARQAKVERHDNRPPHAFRELFRELRELFDADTAGAEE